MPSLTADLSFTKKMRLNRCVIDSPNGSLQLSIPLQKCDNRPVSIRQIQMSEHGDWRHKHWHALQSTYYNSPYFEYYQDDFRHVYSNPSTHLHEFNSQLIDVIVHLLNLDDPHVKALTRDINADKHPFALSPYHQVFAHKHGFLPDLSIVDLLFNMGPESLIVLTANPVGMG